jgi:hypothetical protein
LKRISITAAAVAMLISSSLGTAGTAGAAGPSTPPPTITVNQSLNVLVGHTNDVLAVQGDNFHRRSYISLQAQPCSDAACRALGDIGSR